jgi:hypothetical protein
MNKLFITVMTILASYPGYVRKKIQITGIMRYS